LNDPDVADLGQKIERFGIKKIADQNAGGVALEIVGRGSAASKDGFVDDVVMEEAGRMDEFNGGGQRKTVFARVAAKTRRDQQQQRPEALAPAVNEMMRNVGNQFDVGCDVPVEMRLDLPHFILIGGKDFCDIHVDI
jgi:hypothetical protein